VVVVGGLNHQTFWAALLIGMLHAFGSWWLPQSTLVLIFVVMAVVLIWRPYGLLGRQRPPQSTRIQAHAPFVAPVLRWRIFGLVALAFAIVLPMLIGDYAIVIATEVAIAAVLAASLHFGMGFQGHRVVWACGFFGLGAYAVADDQVPCRCVCGGADSGADRRRRCSAARWTSSAAVARRLCGDVDACVCADRMVDRDSVVDLTGGDNGVLGLWSMLPAALSSPLAYHGRGVIAVASLAALRRIALAPAALRAGATAAAR
jgi:branched-chain amino acid transport system permease protein